jgi:hypothetical protein
MILLSRKSPQSKTGVRAGAFAAIRKMWTLSTWSTLLIHMSLILPPMMGYQTLADAAATTERLALMEEVSKLAGISYCNEVKKPFDCKLWCSDFKNTTLIEVSLFLYAVSDQRNLRQTISRRYMDTLPETMTAKG